MNKYWEVARTYIYRPAFWMFAAIYLVLGSQLPNETSSEPVSLSLLPVAALTCCLIAIHLRRQFGTAAAMTLPGFAPPHLAMGAVASLSVCVVLPGLLAWKIGANPWATIGRYSVAGILLAAVARKPSAIALLAVIPALVIWFEVSAHDAHSFVTQFLFGDEPGPLTTMFVISLVCQVAAGFYLLRLGTREIAISDELFSPSQLDSAAKGSFSYLRLSQQDAGRSQVEPRRAVGMVSGALANSGGAGLDAACLGHFGDIGAGGGIRLCQRQSLAGDVGFNGLHECDFGGAV